jgi:rRNA maturation RNase YbeY
MRIRYVKREEVEGRGWWVFRRREVGAWIRRVVREYGKEVGEITYMYVSDKEMLKLNREHLGHDYYTDVLTFDYGEGDKVSGEIVISIDRVRENGRVHKEGMERELYRVMIHGVLHLCGLRDETEEERELMREAEDKALEETGGRGKG